MSIYIQWDTERSTAEVSSICKGHARSVEGVAVNSDGVRFASVSWDKMLKVWSLQEMDRDAPDDKGGAKRRRIKKDTTPQPPVTKVSWHPLTAIPVCMDCVVLPVDSYYNPGWPHPSSHRCGVVIH